jgi:hypothetical protein
VSDSDRALDKEILAFIQEAFEENVARYEGESNLRVNAYVREQVLQQVELYWRKLKELALQVSEAEVRLVLPNRKSPSGKTTYNLEGVVDIVRVGDRTVMYDIKTHDVATVRAQRERYERQLNVYADIYESLRESRVDGTAVISTALPARLRKALSGDPRLSLEREIESWSPVVEMNYSREAVERTIKEFGEVVEGIEEGRFHPADRRTLDQDYGGRGYSFAVEVCRNCDARFSCSSYRTYAQGNRRLKEQSVFTLLAETGDELEGDEFRSACRLADDENLRL